jgi:5-methyltetrahydrofolate--homocysteine methyltransferase
MGTMLQSAGMEIGKAPELFNIEEPQVVEKIHLAYLEAGSDIIETNSFGGSPLKLARFGLESQVEELNLKAASIAQQAVRKSGKEALVAGSIGPSGELISPFGTLEPQAAQEAFAIQARALARGGADLILVETMSDLVEAKAALKGALESGLPVWVTMTFEAGGRTNWGVSAKEAQKELTASGASAIGANCSVGPKELLPIARELAQGTLPVIVQPNAGLPQLIDDETVFPLGPEGFAEQAQPLLQYVKIIGGCCGTTPSHIARLQRLIGRG